MSRFVSLFFLHQGSSLKHFGIFFQAPYNLTLDHPY